MLKGGGGREPGGRAPEREAERETAAERRRKRETRGRDAEIEGDRGTEMEVITDRPKSGGKGDRKMSQRGENIAGTE